jgi:hypothetical protein
MEHKHSPAPWSTIEHSWSDTSIFDKDNNVVCSLSVEGECDENNQEQFEQLMAANAKLISKAPKMLEFLKGIVNASPKIWEMEKDDFEEEFLYWAKNVARGIVED